MIANSGNMQGGGGAESCTVTVTFSAPKATLTVYYITPELSELQTREFGLSGNEYNVELNVAKNTIVFADATNPWGVTEITGNVTKIYGELYEPTALYVYGDCFLITT